MNKEKLRIIFMGTPDFAVNSLKILIEHDFNVVGVITAPDKPAGRGRKLNESAVKKYAISQGLNILQPTNLKADEFIKELRTLEANLQVVVAFRMLPEVVWRMPKFGTFNLHASLLPDYRGAAPIHWAIINGEEHTGVTTFFIDEKIDTGEIIFQETTEIAPDETVGSLHDRLMELGSSLVLKTVKTIQNGKVETFVQPKSGDLKTAYKLNKDNCKIDWSLPLNVVYNKIRGLNPFPAAWSDLMNGNEALTVKIYAVEKELEDHTFEAGAIRCEKNALRVATFDGFIKINEIQLPGKRRLEVKALLNGYHFEKNAKML